MGEDILDLGCGDGTLGAAIAERGGNVVGIDFAPDQVKTARARGIAAHVGHGAHLLYENDFDAVFSNAALHWMHPPEDVAKSVFRALRPGGRFIGEMGGIGNVATVRRALLDALSKCGVDGKAFDPWFFPSRESYRDILEEAGFTVSAIMLFDRPTPLPGDFISWLETFAESFLSAVDSARRAALMDAVRAAVRADLCTPEEGWVLDYVRLRFHAEKPEIR
ncbi:class I SAM-dependent methyltransferase [Varunaivibrio sulfuroxidans]|nr:class I SAM-dependent methyltransferase [Varunaivibrio sulfuroxidans]WES31129.1 methyltransferase domain-containing protein [Varunaivibrio sulfuroxidans]